MSENQNKPINKREPNVRLFVGSLPYKFTEGELLSLFVPFGRVVSLKIMHNPWGKSRGLGFVEFDNLNSAIDAKTKLHNFHIDDRSIIVDYAEPDPLNTPEGRERHLEAQAKKMSKFRPPTRNLNPEVSRPRDGKFVNRSFKTDQPGQTTKPPIKPVFGATRQSVYDQRTHHSRVGAKFAARSRSKSKG